MIPKEEREITQSAKKLSGDEKKYNITNHAHVQTRLPAAASAVAAAVVALQGENEGGTTTYG